MNERDRRALLKGEQLPDFSSMSNEEYEKAPFVYMKCVPCEGLKMVDQKNLSVKKTAIGGRCTTCQKPMIAKHTEVFAINHALGVPTFREPLQPSLREQGKKSAVPTSAAPQQQQKEMQPDDYANFDWN